MGSSSRVVRSPRWRPELVHPMMGCQACKVSDCKGLEGGGRQGYVVGRDGKQDHHPVVARACVARGRSLQATGTCEYPSGALGQISGRLAASSHLAGSQGRSITITLKTQNPARDVWNHGAPVTTHRIAAPMGVLTTTIPSNLSRSHEGWRWHD